MEEFYPGCSDSLADFHFHILAEGTCVRLARVCADARTPLLHLNAEGRDKTERRGVRGGGEGDGKLETLTRRGWSGSEPKEDGDEQSHEFFNENDNRSRQTETKGREPVHRHDRKPTLRARTERAGRSD